MPVEARAEAILAETAIVEEPACKLALAWPVLRPEARHGLAGELLEAIEPHSEADPVALLVTFLAAFGALVGPGPHAVAEGAEHPARIWPLIVGDTAKSRKGSSWAQVWRILSAADAAFATDRVLSGFGSGEALVDAVADEQDPRLLVVETEYARVLSVCKREGSTLSTLLRQGWDGGRLQVRSRARTAVADNSHVVVIGHITRAELLAKLAESDTLGGSLNRFLVISVRRSRVLPEGGNLDESVIADFGRNVSYVATKARSGAIIRRSPDAQEYWAHLYKGLAEDDPGGLLGAVIARDAAQVLRLSVTYALLDGHTVVLPEHIKAAEAVWEYARASAAAIFGERTGDTVADQILTELRKSGGELSRTEIRDVLARHRKKERIDEAISLLANLGLATEATKGETGGRPRRVVRATKATKATSVDDAPPIDDAYVASFDNEESS